MNNKKTPLIDAIIFLEDNPGLCPNCQALLYIAESEMNLIAINKDADPIDVVHTEFRCRSFCPTCNYSEPMFKTVDGNYCRIDPYEMYIDNRKREKLRMANLDNLSKLRDKNPMAHIIKKRGD